MKKKYIGMTAGLALFSMAGLGLAQAELITIGTAQLEGVGTEYNLIWDNDNNGNSVVWLDYTKSGANWSTQVEWAAGLDLTYNLYGAYSINWDTNSWRLPSTVDGEFEYGFDGTTTGGYNITSSELGHLYYTELGNLGIFDTSNNYLGDAMGLENTGEFDNLIRDSTCWSGTDYANVPGSFWSLHMASGVQTIYTGTIEYCGLAVRSGQVSEAAPVPEPGTMLLFGTGLASFATFKIKQKKSRV